MDLHSVKEFTDAQLLKGTDEDPETDLRNSYPLFSTLPSVDIVVPLPFLLGHPGNPEKTYTEWNWHQCNISNGLGTCHYLYLL